MKLSQFKSTLQELKEIQIRDIHGKLVPAHFHITEAGITTKRFVDCGGTTRVEKTFSFQLWVEQDIDHRLSPEKLLGIIKIAEDYFGDDDLEIEMEYQQDTIGRYRLDFMDGKFQLVATQTDCLAKDKCGIPESKPKVSLADLQAGTCAPGSGCC